ncbi:tyrosinase family protein [Urechidicola croceus]|uniref:Tyrosinase copper-binding domain-containing protein n=1 Tax=Urechidicola croceus TaxID=1850246 RepID=A0A1D8P699_9FLAO|nr:tyrosinase family protein [Urechidicola croceus]AOW20093.1 hypothetical protein LPB138_05090 [Urechidicola croceus]
MKKFIFIITILFILPKNLYSQAIRKNYLEMTDSEKLELQNAFYQMRDLDNDNGANDPDTDDDDLMNDLGDFHLNFFNFDGTATPDALDIHLNLANAAVLSEPEREIFFAWHRVMIFELEQMMQNYFPNISIPYWDSTQEVGYDNATVVNEINNTIFTEDFLGPFNADWGLNRNVGGRANELPNTDEINTAMSNTVFFSFSNEAERGRAHAGVHRWIGGVMPTSASSRDPVFYLHHAFVDKLWHDWQLNPANEPSAYHPDRVNMLRYDGTYSFYGTTHPSIDPDDVIDSKVYGTFYAENQLATLEDYTVSNTYKAIENFYYQFTINAGNNFNIPANTSCKFESVNEVILSPGFTAEEGSVFTAKIDSDNDINTSARGASQKGVYNPYDYNPNVQEIIFEETSLSVNDVTIIYSFPNPFKDHITLNFNQNVQNCKVEIYNMMSMVIREETYSNVSTINFAGLNNLMNGTYLLKVVDLDTDKPIIIRRFIKL